MKRSKIALAITLSISALFLTACNDDDDDYIGVNPDKTYISEKLFSRYFKWCCLYQSDDL